VNGSTLRSNPAISACGQVRRAIVDDLDGVLAKAEGYFGRRLTIIGLAIICVGAVSASLNSIWQNLLDPLWYAFTKTGLNSAVIEQSGEMLFAIILLTATIHETRRAKEAKQKLIVTEDLLDRAEKAFRQAVAEGDTARDRLRKFDENLTASNLMMESIAVILRDQGTIGQEKADMILSLLCAEPEP
jgi:hypothetical protein